METTFDQEPLGWPLDLRVALPRVDAHDFGVVFRAKFNDGTLVGISRPSKAEETAFVQ